METSVACRHDRVGYCPYCVECPTDAEEGFVEVDQDEIDRLNLLARRARKNGPVVISMMTDEEMAQFDRDIQKIARRSMYSRG